MKKVLILGSGGHGWESLSEFFDSNNNQIDLYTLTSDWGGFTGTFGRLMEVDNGIVNQKLHKKILPILPWGDLNKIITFYTSLRFGTNVGQTLNFRSFHIYEVLQEFEILSDFLALEHSVIKHFEEYLHEFYNLFGEYQHKIDLIKAPCLGNLWQQYLFWQLDNIESWNEFYRYKNILPQNLHLNFTADQRQVLTAQTSDSSKIIGEEIIDVSEVPILPESLNLVNLDEQKSELEENLLSKLRSADCVIIPNGSVANWIPLLNNTEILDIIKHKKLIWILNLFHTQNELNISKYLEYTASLGLNPSILAPKKLPPEVPTEILNHYNLENKVLNFKSVEEIDQVKSIGLNIKFELDYQVDSSFKYSKASIKQSILNILHES